MNLKRHVWIKRLPPSIHTNSPNTGQHQGIIYRFKRCFRFAEVRPVREVKATATSVSWQKTSCYAVTLLQPRTARGMHVRSEKKTLARVNTSAGTGSSSRKPSQCRVTSERQGLSCSFTQKRREPRLRSVGICSSWGVNHWYSLRGMEVTLHSTKLDYHCASRSRPKMAKWALKRAFSARQIPLSSTASRSASKRPPKTRT